MRSEAAGLAVLLMVACTNGGASDGMRACIDDNPPGSPFDIGDVIVGSPPPGFPAPDPPSADTIAADCVMNGGTGCDARAFISKDAASCIATLQGFEVGLEPWQIALTFHNGYKRVVWNVLNKLVDRGGGAYTGQVLTIDATGDRVLGKGAYGATP